MREVKLTFKSFGCIYPPGGPLEQPSTQENFGPVPRFSILSADISLDTYYYQLQDGSRGECGCVHHLLKSFHKQDKHEGFLCERNCSVITADASRFTYLYLKVIRHQRRANVKTHLFQGVQLRSYRSYVSKDRGWYASEMLKPHQKTALVSLNDSTDIVQDWLDP